MMDVYFYVFRCTFCGRWGVKEIRYGTRKAVFKCFFCNKSKKVNKNNEFGLSMSFKGPFENPRAATLVCQELNKQGLVL